VDAAQRRVSDELDTATKLTDRRARIITGPELRAPPFAAAGAGARAGKCWTTARGDDAMRNLLLGGRAGKESPAYASPEAATPTCGTAQLTGPRSGSRIWRLGDGFADSRPAVAGRDGGWYKVRVMDGPQLPGKPAVDPAVAEVEHASLRYGIGYGHDQWGRSLAARNGDEPMPVRSARSRRGLQSARVRSGPDQWPGRRSGLTGSGQPATRSWIGRRRA